MNTHSELGDLSLSVKRLATRIDNIDSDIAFLAQMIQLKPTGHATESEFKRLTEIGERCNRFKIPNA